jgi:hypothetical protein
VWDDVERHESHESPCSEGGMLTAFTDFRCMAAWAGDSHTHAELADPNTWWDPVRWGALAFACAEGAHVGAAAGPWGAVIGCGVAGLALDLGAENARHRLEDEGLIEKEEGH